MFTFKKFALVGAIAAAFSMSCSDDKEDPDDVIGDDPDLKRSSFDLSFAGASYGDVDAAKTYKQGELAAVKGNIDLVAYYASGASDDVKNPCIVEQIGPDDCGWPSLYPIPGKYSSALKSAKKVSEINDFLTAFADGEIGDDDDEEDEISIAKDKAFLVFSTENKFFVVVITDKGAEKVSLNFFKTPEKK